MRVLWTIAISTAAPAQANGMVLRGGVPCSGRWEASKQ